MRKESFYGVVSAEERTKLANSFSKEYSRKEEGESTPLQSYPCIISSTQISLNECSVESENWSSPTAVFSGTLFR
jgi:hypothetical protein